MKNIHSVHIPVMGTAFSIDTPIKVAQYGISSVISLVDDTLIEQMRKFYCEKMGKEYSPITKYEEDHRARRITAYLDLVDDIVKQKFNEVQNSNFEPGSEITRYFEMLADDSSLKRTYLSMLQERNPQIRKSMQENLRRQMKPGSIDVNIMTKLDRVNFGQGKKELPIEFSDALSALRGYAKSKLESAIVFSAGINRRLYTYVEKFEDFYADATGYIKKKIILKVSDYRSSIIQGRFFAKKGLWVTEYRIESGLNCGGHAFASDGFLMGPILEEFKTKKDELISSIHSLYVEALEKLRKPVASKPRNILITAQGGIGTSLENKFLLDHYEIDGTGWATPFLLVPEVTNVDSDTLKKLSSAGEDDLYLSPISPLGVPFNNLKGNFSDLEKMRRVDIGRPGSACPKGHLVSNMEFTEKPICTASRQYQKLKIEQLDSLNLTSEAYRSQFDKVISKACICHDLGESVLLKNSMDEANKKKSTAICPGPNLAYFSKVSTLREMMGHIYGRVNLLNDTYRPHMFIKELKMYVEYFFNEVKKSSIEPTEKQIAYLNEFKDNMFSGIEYYRELYPKMMDQTVEFRNVALSELQFYKAKIDVFISKYKSIFNSSISNLATS